jgi:hypothetical protein
MMYWTAAPMAAQGARKGEPSSSSMRHGLRPPPARSVRGSSRRIMTLRFRPANIRVINRRAGLCAAIRLLSQIENQECSKLTSGNVFPPTPPVEAWSMPERCSSSRVRSAAPNYGAPLTAARRSSQTIIATGGSGGNTRTARAKNKRPAFLPLVGTPAEIKTPSNRGA